MLLRIDDNDDHDDDQAEPELEPNVEPDGPPVAIDQGVMPVGRIPRRQSLREALDDPRNWAGARGRQR